MLLPTFNDLDISRTVRSTISKVASRPRPPVRPLIVASHRRSGSTLLRDLLASSKYTTAIDQPLDPWQNVPGTPDVLTRTSGTLFGATSRELDEVAEWLRSVVSGGTDVRRNWAIHSPGFPWRWDHAVLKVLNGAGGIQALQDRLGWHIVVLTRDPVSVVASVRARGWPAPVGPAPSDDDLAEVHERLQRSDPMSPEAILYAWYLGTVPLLRLDPSPTLVHYENLAADPVAQVRATANSISWPLGDVEKLSMIPSRTTSTNSAEQIRCFGPHSRSTNFTDTNMLRVRLSPLIEELDQTLMGPFA